MLFLGILAEVLHYFRCGHYNTYTNKSRQKHDKKLTLALFIKSKLSVEVNIFSNQILSTEA